MDESLPPHRTAIKILARTSNTEQGAFANLEFHFHDRGGMKSTIVVHDVCHDDIDPLIDQLLEARIAVKRHIESPDRSAPGTGLLGPMER